MLKSKITACSERCRVVTVADLPLSCPMPDMTLWNAHPRVYLPIQESGQCLCPYCGTEYVLQDFQAGS